MVRTEVVAGTLTLLLAAVALGTGCSSSTNADASDPQITETHPTCLNGIQDGDELGVDCGGTCVTACETWTTPPPASSSASGGPPGPDGGTAPGMNGIKDGTETDVDCGGASAPKCVEGKTCAVDGDCEVACGYAKKCVGAPSCAVHMGGDTCGKGEVDEPGAQHESCCRTLKVPGFTDAAHPGKTVYLDKYEITAGRIRAFVERLARDNAGKPDVKGWIAAHRPQIWDTAWDAFLPSDTEGGSLTIGRRLLGDPRPEDNGQTGNPGPGVILPPDTDQAKHMGTNYQFGSEVYVDLHGNNCGNYPGSYGFPTYYYPADILARDGQLPRPDATGSMGQTIPAKDWLDVKAMNCITNAMLAAFCEWDGGQLATDEVLDFVTDTPAALANVSGCGTQRDDHDKLLGNNFTGTVQTGGTCPPVALVNATFDAGDSLPVAGSPLNIHNYNYPNLGNVTHDKAWQVSAPGRVSTAAGAMGQAVDAIRLNPGDEPWMDLHGNMNEAALDMSGATFTGFFALKFRGIGYGSARSQLNVGRIKDETIRRIQRPEAKAGYTGGRCMRFK